MSTNVKLTIAVTESSSADFDVVVSVEGDKFYARIHSLGLAASGSGARDALQGLVKLIQQKESSPMARAPRAG